MLHLVVSCHLAGTLTAPFWTFRTGILETYPSHFKCLCPNWSLKGSSPVLFRITVFRSMFQWVTPRSFSFGRLLVFGCPAVYYSVLLHTTLVPLHALARLTHNQLLVLSSATVFHTMFQHVTPKLLTSFLLGKFYIHV